MIEFKEVYLEEEYKEILNEDSMIEAFLIGDSKKLNLYKELSTKRNSNLTLKAFCPSNYRIRQNLQIDILSFVIPESQNYIFINKNILSSNKETVKFSIKETYNFRYKVYLPDTILSLCNKMYMHIDTFKIEREFILNNYNLVKPNRTIGLRR